MKYRVTCEGSGWDIEVRGGGEDGPFELQVDGETIPVLLERGGGAIRRLVLGDSQREFGFQSSGEGNYHIGLDGNDYQVSVVDARMARFQQVSTQEDEDDSECRVEAPIPGLVVRVDVGLQQTVEAGQCLLVLDAMKLENEIVASAAGRVEEILVCEGDAVEKGQVLVRLSR
ncbi:MAG: biotin/lipoyl-binding protein [Planctomycetota bacterium]|nr:biotin/lipoyl-binding protein [Planctomycetota bacterium]